MQNLWSIHTNVDPKYYREDKIGKSLEDLQKVYLWVSIKKVLQNMRVLFTLLMMKDKLVNKLKSQNN